MPSYLPLYGLTTITGIIHIGIGLSTLGDSLGLLLLINGIGYLGLIFAHVMIEYWGVYRRGHQYLLLVYTLASIIAYFVTFPLADALSDTTGMAAKIVEIAIIIVLVIHIRRYRKQIVKQ